VEPNLDVRQPPTNVETILVRWSGGRWHVVVEFRATNGAVLASALDELDDAEPMEGVVAGKTAALGHHLFANGAFLPCGLGVIDQRVMVIDVSQESAELSKLIDFLV